MAKSRTIKGAPKISLSSGSRMPAIGPGVMQGRVRPVTGSEATRANANGADRSAPRGMSVYREE